MGTLLLDAFSPELDDHGLHSGDTIERWISGALIRDHPGWSLLTARLSLSGPACMLSVSL